MSNDLLCFFSGRDVYVLEPTEGKTKAHLQMGAEKVGCTSRYVLVGEESSRWVVSLTTFDSKHFRPVWRRAFSHSLLWEVTAKGNTFRLLLSEPPGPGGYSLVRYEKILLSAEDGRIISRGRVQRPAEYDIIPKGLPPRMRKWLTGLLGRKGGVFIRRTNIVRRRALWFVGNCEDHTAPGRIFAVRGATAHVVWQRPLAGVERIILHERDLIVAECIDRTMGWMDTRKTPGRLIALDARTGRLVWTVDLAGPSGGRN